MSASPTPAELQRIGKGIVDQALGFKRDRPRPLFRAVPPAPDFPVTTALW